MLYLMVYLILSLMLANLNEKFGGSFWSAFAMCLVLTPVGYFALCLVLILLHVILFSITGGIIKVVGWINGNDSLELEVLTKWAKENQK